MPHPPQQLRAWLRAALALGLLTTLASCGDRTEACSGPGCDPPDTQEAAPCLENDDCPIGKRCDQGTCAEPPPCGADLECPPLEQCVQGGCYRREDLPDDPADAGQPDADAPDADDTSDADPTPDAEAPEDVPQGPCDPEGHGPPDEFEPNDACAAAYFVGDHPTPATSIDIKPYFHRPEDVFDHFSFTVDDAAIGGNQYILVSLSFVPEGHRYRMSLFKGVDGCEAGRALGTDITDEDQSASIFFNEDPDADDSGLYIVRLQRLEGFSCEAGRMFVRFQASSDR